MTPDDIYTIQHLYSLHPLFGPAGWEEYISDIIDTTVLATAIKVLGNGSRFLRANKYAELEPLIAANDYLAMKKWGEQHPEAWDSVYRQMVNKMQADIGKEIGDARVEAGLPRSPSQS